MFRIITLFTFWDMRSEMREMFVYKHTQTMEYIKNHSSF